MSLLVAEKGACWVERALAWRTPANEVLALLQSYEESHDEFCCRIERRLERFRDKQVWLEQILLLEGTDSEHSSGTRRMLQSIVGKLGAGPRPARVLLVPSAPNPVVAMPWESLSRARSETFREPLLQDLSYGQNSPGGYSFATAGAAAPGPKLA